MIRPLCPYGVVVQRLTAIPFPSSTTAKDKQPFSTCERKGAGQFLLANKNYTGILVKAVVI